MANNAVFLHDPLIFMNLYPLHPVKGPEKVERKPAGYFSVPKDDRVAFMDIEQGLPPNAKGLQELDSDNLLQGAIAQSHIATCYDEDNPLAPRIPVFWLPYRRQSTFRITLIPQVGKPQPNFFLTAALDGCSVYVEGNRATPTVHHINAVDTKYRAPDGIEHGLTGDFDNDTRVFRAKSDHMTAAFHGTKPPKHSPPGPRSARFIANDDYMLRDPIAMSIEASRTQSTGVQVSSPHTVTESRIATMGTVIGIRDTVLNQWTFYFQQRLIAIYLRNRREHDTGFFRKPTPVSHTFGYRSVPLTVREFWPNGSGSAI